MKLRYIFFSLVATGLIGAFPVNAQTSDNSIFNSLSQITEQDDNKQGQSLVDAARDLPTEEGKADKKPETAYTLEEIKYYKGIDIYTTVIHFMVNDPKIHFDLLNKNTQEQIEKGLPDYFNCLTAVNHEVDTIIRGKEPLARMMGEEVIALSLYQQQQINQMRVDCYDHFYPKKPQII